MNSGPQAVEAMEAKPARAALFLVSLAGALVSYLAFADFVFEDSYITLRYAKNLALGRGFVFQTGEAVLGTSSPLWTLSLALLIRLGVPAELALDLASCTSLVGLSYAGGRLLPRLGAPRAGLLFAAAVSLGVGRLQGYWGMETPLFLGLLFGAWCLVLDRRYAWAGALLGLACVARYEGYAFALALALVLAARGSWPAIRQGGLTLAAATLPWLAFAWLYFGRLIPQTAGAKAGHVTPLRYFERSYLDLPQDLHWPIDSLPYPYAAGLLIGILTGILGARSVWRLLRERAHVALALPLGALFVFATLIAMSPGPAFAWHRAPVHFVGLLYALAAWRPRSPAPGTGARQALRAAAFLAALLVAIPILRSAAHKLSSTFQYAGREETYVELADFLVQTRLNERTLLTWEPGYLAFLSDTRVIDLVGLVTPAPTFTQTSLASWDSDFPPEADMVLLRAPYHPRGFDLLYEGSMGARLFVRTPVAASYAARVAEYRAGSAPQGETPRLSQGPLRLLPAFPGLPFVLGQPGAPTRIVPQSDPLALTAETVEFWIDTPGIEVEFQTPTPEHVQLQLVVRGVIVRTTEQDPQRSGITVKWDLGPWQDRSARVRVLALAGQGARASFGAVLPRD